MRRRPFQKFDGEYLFETRRMARVALALELVLFVVLGTTAWVVVVGG